MTEENGEIADAGRPGPGEAQGAPSPQEGTVDARLAEMQDGIDEIRAKVSKALDIYSLMSEYRNNAELMLTRLTEVVARLYALSVFCESEIGDLPSGGAAIVSLRKRVAALLAYAVKVAGSFGVTPIMPAAGEAFDPEEHLIMGSVDAAPGGALPGTVSSCERMGYVRNGRVTPAEIIVVREETEKGE